MTKYLKEIPKLMKEYHFEKNLNIDFKILTHGSHRKVWWKCKKNHEWESQVKSRFNGSRCPYCTGKKVCQENCLSTTHPKLSKEWSSKNNLKPTQITFGSNKKFWWECHLCGKEWVASPGNRSKGRGCPYCSNKKVCKENCLSNISPELAKEWDYDKNKIKPTEIVSGSIKKIWWTCEKGHQWLARISDRCSRKTNCPYCSNKKACKDNCLKTTHPHLLKEWNHHKNKIKPEEVLSGSDIKVWWKCNNNHEWESKISNRSRGKNCPYCSNKKVCKENCLKNISPILAKEWSNKNKLKSYEIVSGSNKKYWWTCKKCKHEWKSSPNTRIIQKSNCPKCNESKGEKLVSKILDLLKIRYKREYRFKELGQKRFDFALFEKYKRKPYTVIEYHGRQHYEIVNFSKDNKKNINNFNTLQYNDNAKKQYCLDNNIKYLEIPYSEKDNSEQLIREFLK